MDVYTCTHIQTHMAADKPHEKGADKDKHLRKQDVQNKPHIPHANTIVHHCLGQEGGDERQ